MGGCLALVQEGDMIELDVQARRLHLDVSDEELERRRAAWNALRPMIREAMLAYIQVTCFRQIKAWTSIS